MDGKAFICAVETAWRSRTTTARGRQLTRLHVHIAAKLAFWRHGSAPRHRALARVSRCSISTVRRALAILHSLGLLTWTRRVLACKGWRAQISNAYAFSSKAISYQCLRRDADLNTSGGALGMDAPLLAARRAEIERRFRDRAAVQAFPAGSR